MFFYINPYPAGHQNALIQVKKMMETTKTKKVSINGPGNDRVYNSSLKYPGGKNLANYSLIQLFNSARATGNDVSVRIDAIEELSRRSSNNAAGYLVKLLDNERIPELRMVAAYSLARFSGKKVVSALVKAKRDKNKHVKWTASRCLVKIKIGRPGSLEKDLFKGS